MAQLIGNGNYSVKLMKCARTTAYVTLLTSSAKTAKLRGKEKETRVADRLVQVNCCPGVLMWRYVEVECDLKVGEKNMAMRPRKALTTINL